MSTAQAPGDQPRDQDEGLSDEEWLDLLDELEDIDCRLAGYVDELRQSVEEGSS